MPVYLDVTLETEGTLRLIMQLACPASFIGAMRMEDLVYITSRTLSPDNAITFVLAQN